ncbi:hypothetical protein FisN_2Lh057 [Fistulifera solaris]|uniref:Mitochondrial pyruvate carrier n=1 Tax=Fistulifera solaris TaxID=1519565 RepID=A0A1Z5JWJ8_FISSO|nr:hypothetical protein FisN_2Lh057 [Fistulifera solaris]|eukprot:GAX18420.1 hypothetical protein FisN_2Lh057 [Fistulifera solaris]
MSMQRYSTLLQQIVRRQQQQQRRSQGLLSLWFHADPTNHHHCFFTYWSLLGACAGWSMTASSESSSSSPPPSLAMTQDVVLYSTAWAIASLCVTRNLSLVACHLSNVGTILYHYLENHAERCHIKSYRADDWQCHGERTES